MKIYRSQQAFTLTELLVVVLIIGVLSAVALPKFSRAVETRRTAEAEELLTAVRTEQEKRCTLDKPYAGSFDKLGHIVASASASSKTETKNYSYQLEESGISATSLEKDYKLALPSYSDGRLCCEGSYCESLNKNYPSCASLNPTPALCTADLCEVSKECTAGATETRACECGYQSRTCSGGCQWSAWSGSCGTKSGGRTETKNCEEIQSNLRGTTTRVCAPTCDGQGSCPAWTTAGCGNCSAPEGEPVTQNCPNGYAGTQTRTWNSSTCAWNAWQGTCTCNPPAGEPTSQNCPNGASGTQTRTWDYSACRWGEWQGACETEKIYEWTHIGTNCEGIWCDYNNDDSLWQYRDACPFSYLNDANRKCTQKEAVCVRETTQDGIDISQNNECADLGYCYSHTDWEYFKCQAKN